MCAELTQEEVIRYQRHLSLPGVWVVGSIKA